MSSPPVGPSGRTSAVLGAGQSGFAITKFESLLAWAR